MSEQASLDVNAGLGRGETPVTGARPKWSTADRVRVFVLTAIFLVLTVSVFVQHTEPIFGVAVATAWTALFAIVWELAARVLARVRA